MIYTITADNLREGIVGIDLPASKSLSNRALILKALCDGECKLAHLSDCDDTRVMLKAFEDDPSTGSETDGNTRIVDIGAAGTSMRFLTAYFATREGRNVVMTGSARMKQRPIGILVNALRELGADIEYAEAEGFPPLRIHGKQLKGGALSIDGSTSSQYISALLMIAPTLSDGLTLTLTGSITSRPYIDMTLAMMREFGVSTAWTADNRIEVKPQRYTAKAYSVESDWSASSYWYEICAIASRTRKSVSYELKGLKPNSLQGDSKVAAYFSELGVKTTFNDEGAVITCDGNQELPSKVEWDLGGQPDLAQTIIVSCCCLGIPFDIKGLHTLRIKETDRITALQTELSRFGYAIDAHGDDRMTWDGTQNDNTCIAPIVRTYDDHRMAMAFAPFGIDDSPAICNPEVVTKSYPTYWNDLRSAGFMIEEEDISPEELEGILKKAIERNMRTRTKAKWILNTLLALAALLIVWLCVKCTN